MSDLPDGWEWTTLDEITQRDRPICYGILMPKGHVDTGVPYVKVKDFSRGPLDVASLQRTAPEIANKYQRSSLLPGDVLFSIRGTYGRVTIVPEQLSGANITQDTARVSPVRGVSPVYLALYLRSPQAQGYCRRVARGVAVKGVNIRDLRLLPVPIASTREQERIVTAVEEHLSRLDSAEDSLRSAERRVSALEKAIITESAGTRNTPSTWESVTVADAGAVSLGLQRSPKRHSGPQMRPYLKVANVFEDRIDGSDLMSMNMTDAEWQRYRLRSGDVLLNEGQSPELLGRPAIYRGEPSNVAFTNSLIRFQAYSHVDPEWALLVFRSHMHNQRFMRESRITTNIAHLAAGRFKTVEFPLPPIHEQKARVAVARGRLEHCGRIHTQIQLNLQRSVAARQSILAAAFSGRLVPSDPHDEPASVLLKRIRAELAATPSRRRTRRVTA